jgi:hypothetical protein
MRSFFLIGLESVVIAKEALRAQLPGQEEPWLLCASSGEPIAYFNVGTLLDDKQSIHIQADISGRHYTNDAVVVETLRALQASIGGVITNDA